MRAVVFLGPSWSAEQAGAILPDAIVRGPATQGDILAAVVRDRADAIGLIDGAFGHGLAVWHNEICYAASRGVTVYGAAGAGALRAAETERFGTIGIGEVFAWYRDGILVSDDEVAVAEPEHRPLVGVRATLAAAVTGHRIEPAVAARVITATQSIRYPDRSLATILAASHRAGIDDASLRAVEHALTAGYVDVQARDAERLLRRMAADLAPGGRRPVPPAFDFQRSSSFDTLYNLDRRVEHDGAEVPLQFIGEHVALHHPDFEERQAAALHRGIVVRFAELLGVTVTDDDLTDERRRFAAARDLPDAAAVDAWTAANDITGNDLDDLIRDLAICRRMRRWIQHTEGLDRGSRLILDELRRTGGYPEWAARAAAEGATATAFRDQPGYRELAAADPRELLSTTGVRIDGDAATWARDRGFDGEAGLREALERSAIARDVRDRVARVMAAGAIDG